MKPRFLLPWLAAVALLGGRADVMGEPNGGDAPSQAPTAIQGLPAAPGGVEFFRNGKPRSLRLAQDHAVEDTVFPTGSEVRFKDTGEVDSCVLSRPAEVAGFSLPVGAAIWFRSGRREGAWLPRDTVVRGLPLPANTHIFFSSPWENSAPDSWRLWLPVKTMLQGHLCAITDDGCGHVVYADGRLRAVKLARDEEIDGVPCTSSQNPLRMPVRVMFYGLDAMVWLHENGHLQQAVQRQLETGMAPTRFRHGVRGA